MQLSQSDDFRTWTAVDNFLEFLRINKMVKYQKSGSIPLSFSQTASLKYPSSIKVIAPASKIFGTTFK